ncbi:MAG: type II toxin-antitoxin system HicB family antitoxin [Patescibacteria group bacterium]
MKATIFQYRVIIRKEGKNYIADVPTLGISDFGKTLETAKKNAQKAITCHIEGLAKTNTEVPAPDTSDYYVSTAQVSFSRLPKFAV